MIIREDIDDLGNELESYWIEPGNKIHDASGEGSHMSWIADNLDKIYPYVSKEIFDEWDGWRSEDEDEFRQPLEWLIAEGWVRLDRFEGAIVAEIQTMVQVPLIVAWLEEKGIKDINEVYIAVYDTGQDYELSMDEIKSVGLRKAMINFNKRGGIQASMKDKLNKFLEGEDLKEVLEQEDPEGDLQQAVIDLLADAGIDTELDDSDVPDVQTWEHPGHEGGMYGHVDISVSNEAIDVSGFSIDDIKLEIEKHKDEYLGDVLLDVSVQGDDPDFEVDTTEIKKGESGLVITVNYSAGYDEEVFKPMEP